ncbi:MAG: hypothetical protein IPK63_15820 [Candidatus Competibacteraceae bacterium]|nr:hypothetical protein [Candidatus Competibacteraceae bacterium]
MAKARITVTADVPRPFRRDRAIRQSPVICPHCPQCVTSYRFTMGDGLPITTHHCAEHGDVISRGVSSHTTTHNEEER